MKLYIIKLIDGDEDYASIELCRHPSQTSHVYWGIEEQVRATATGLRHLANIINETADGLDAQEELPAIQEVRLDE